MDQRVREATPADAETLGRLLDDFNREFDEATPGPEFLARRVLELMDSDDELFLVTGDPPFGLAYLRFRPSLWADGLECWLAELYVEPGQRRRGFGRGLLEASVAEARKRGAKWIELGTEDTDVAARALYESMGFTNFDDGGDQMLFYEREL
jgi:ribosomal protein S18 acetylase RimI-like enzyme